MPASREAHTYTKSDNRNTGRERQPRVLSLTEQLTDRKVVAFISQAPVEPDLTIEVFFVDRPLDGYGAVEIIDPHDH